MVGSIEVICGPMFSGKTEELLRRLRRAVIAKRSVVAVKHALDARYSPDGIDSHDGRGLRAVPCSDAAEIPRLAVVAHVVGVDEAQFFGPALPTVVERMARSGQRVILAGLDLDAEGRPFGTMPSLLALADRVDKLAAVCVRCGAPATRSYHPGKTVQVEVGATQYEARCRACWMAP